MLFKKFRETLYRTENLITEGSGWIIELIDSKYINISTYRPDQQFENSNVFQKSHYV